MNEVLMMLDNEGTAKCQNFHHMRKSYMQGKIRPCSKQHLCWYQGGNPKIHLNYF
jgi:hypothetical protein